MPPSAIPSGALCSATASGTATRSPSGTVNWTVATLQPSKKLCRAAAAISGSGKSVQLGGAGIVIVVVGAGGADGVGEAVDQDQQSVAGGEEDRGWRSIPSRRPVPEGDRRAATPSSTPALNGTTMRARRRRPVSQSPSAAPASPIAVARTGAVIPGVGDNTLL